MKFNKITLLYGLFNEFVFQEAKMMVEHLKGYYYYDGDTKENNLVKRLIYIIENYKFTDITEATFISTLVEDGKSDGEIQDIIQKIKEYKLFTKDQATIFRNELKRLCYTYHQNKVEKLYGDDIVKYVEELKKFEYKSNYSDTLIVKNFNQLEITDLISNYSDSYKSRYKFINDSYTCGGYINGQIIMVVGAPATGKSLFLQGEAVNFIEQGKRCYYLALGDLGEADLVSRMICMISRQPKYKVENDIGTFFEMYRHKFSDLLGITIVPSGYIKPTDFVNWMLGRIEEYDILFIDYDSNFAKDPNLSMYDQYGDIYDMFTQLTRKQKLVFVACQPKISYWNEELLPLDAAGESARKQHITDMVITIGRNPESSIPMGKLYIAKNRRGEQYITQHYIRTNEGLFYPCSKGFYTKYRSNKKVEGYFSYSELEGLDILDEQMESINNNQKLKG